jgi:hypothetical protein
VIKIDWDEYKIYKKTALRENNFEILLEFMRSYYNMHSPQEIFEILNSDDIAEMMLQKREITNAEQLENFLYKI